MSTNQRLYHCSPDWGNTSSMSLESINSSLNNLRMAGESEIVVSTEVQDWSLRKVVCQYWPIRAQYLLVSTNQSSVLFTFDPDTWTLTSWVEVITLSVFQVPACLIDSRSAWYFWLAARAAVDWYATPCTVSSVLETPCSRDCLSILLTTVAMIIWRSRSSWECWLRS